MCAYTREAGHAERREQDSCARSPRSNRVATASCHEPCTSDHVRARFEDKIKPAWKSADRGQFPFKTIAGGNTARRAARSKATASAARKEAKVNIRVRILVSTGTLFLIALGRKVTSLHSVGRTLRTSPVPEKANQPKGGKGKMKIATGLGVGSLEQGEQAAAA